MVMKRTTRTLPTEVAALKLRRIQRARVARRKQGAQCGDNALLEALPNMVAELNRVLAGFRGAR